MPQSGHHLDQESTAEFLGCAQRSFNFGLTTGETWVIWIAVGKVRRLPLMAAQYSSSQAPRFLADMLVGRAVFGEGKESGADSEIAVMAHLWGFG
jgi:hypothetical protein